jgi:HlyD family secretion protein
MGMDRPVAARRRRPSRRLLIAAAAAAAAALLAYLALSGGRARAGASPEAAASDARVAEVRQAAFQEFIRVNAYVEAAARLVIDAKEGGVVKRVLADSGSVVAKGELLVELASPDLESALQLKEAALAGAAAAARGDGLRAELQGVEASRDLLEADRKIGELERSVARKEALVEAGGVPRSDLEDARSELDYARKGRALLEQSRELDAELLREEAERTGSAAESLRIERDALARRKAELRIVAPALGQVASLSASEGQSLAPNSRVAELDIMEDLRLRADVDEYYLPRVRVGLRGSFSAEDASGAGPGRGMTVSRVSPNVRNSAFEVEFACEGGTEGLRIGQRLAARVELGEGGTAIVLPMGPFYRDTGGNWVYVVDGSGKSAARRAVSPGRSNPDFLEILGGLSPGERVVISGYSGYGGAERISLKGGSAP